jgi:hypothetical protein
VSLTIDRCARSSLGQVSKAGVKAVAEQLAHELRNDGDLISVHLLV